MEINHNNINEISGSIASRLLIALSDGELPLRTQGRGIIWTEHIKRELIYWLENDNPEPAQGNIEVL